MPEIIKNKEIVEDHWQVLRLAEGETPDTVSIPDGDVIVPLSVWQAQREKLQDRSPKAIWLNSDELIEDLEEDLSQFAIIAIDFPVFSDGRGYSTAYSLRMRSGYRGEVRAIGDVLRDQLFYMQRAGFDAFAVRSDKNIRDAIKGLSDFTEKYQASWDEKVPLFRRVRRASNAS